MKVTVVLAVLSCASGINAQCNPTITTVGGIKAPSQVCAGQLIFEDNFDSLNLDTWAHEITLSGGSGNWEFQLYNNNRSNSWAENGTLHIRPTLTSDQYGQNFLASGTIDLDRGGPDACTDASFYGCKRVGNPTHILNPIKSAKLRTVDSFHFRYGRFEARAKMPVGDWLWPAIWMMPRYNSYGSWPASGEIDITEVRSNANLQLNDVNIGVEQTGSTMHYGPFWPYNGYENAHFTTQKVPALNDDFHTYGMEWTDEHIKFTVDDVTLGTVSPPPGGFWEKGGFAARAPHADNPWRNGSLMAPFDQQFYIIMNLAVGGTNSYFPDQAVNNPPKPWTNKSPHASLDFWNARNDWYPTWNNGTGDSSHLQVDYIRVWAI